MRKVFRASDGTDLAYYVDDFTDPWKDSETLVMLHSAMGSAKRFYAMVPALSRRYRVVRLDLRGHGTSEIPPPEPPLTMDRLAKDVRELLEEIKAPAVHLLGNSAGGYIAQNVAIRFPKRVRSLLLFGSTTGLKGTNATSWLPRVAKEGLRPFLKDTIAYRFDVDTTDPGLVSWFLDEVCKNDVEYVGRFIGLMTTIDTTDELHKILCPTLVVIPGAETETGIRNYDAMKTRIPNVTVRYYSGVRHNMMDSAPDQCVANALEFLETVSQP
jgi:3-oxoadipate enol-lactonase